MRTNSRLSARAIDSPTDVLPVPGGPISVRIAPERLSLATPRSSRSLRTARYSTIRSFTSVEPGVVGVEHLARMHGVEPLLGALAPRHGQQPVQVRADHRRLAGLVAHPLEPRQLTLELLAHGLRQLQLLDLGAVVVGGRSAVLAELLADRLQLAAQHVLALLLGGPFLDVLADAPANLQLGQALALHAQGDAQPLEHVDRLEQLQLVLVGDLGRVGRRVGQSACLANRAHERRDPPVVAAQLEDLLDGRAVLTLQLPGLNARRLLVGSLLDLDQQPALRVGVSRPGDAAVQAREADRTPATRQTMRVADLGDRSHLHVLALVARDEEHTLLVADVDGDADSHIREDDGVVERDEQQGAHGLHSPWQATEKLDSSFNE